MNLSPNGAFPSKLFTRPPLGGYLRPPAMRVANSLSYQPQLHTALTVI